MDIEPFCCCNMPIFGCRQKLGIQTTQKQGDKDRQSQCICGNYLRHIRSGARHIRKKDSFFV